MLEFSNPLASLFKFNLTNIWHLLAVLVLTQTGFVVRIRRRWKQSRIPEGFDGEEENGPKPGIVVQGSFVRWLSVEEHIETLIFYYEGLIYGLKTDYEGKCEAMRKTMEVEMNKLKAGFETQISEIKSLVDVEVAEIWKANVGKLSEMRGLQEIQCFEMFKLKEEIHKARKLITMVKYLLFAIFIYFICKKFN